MTSKAPASPTIPRRPTRAAARTVDGVRDLEKCFVRKMGFEFFVDLHVLVDADHSVREGHRIAHATKDAIQAAYPRITEVLIHIEPYEGPRES